MDAKPKCILVSACLLGERCKYNGGHNYNQALVDYVADKDVIAICPEVLAGLPTPREPVELVDGHVLDKMGNCYDDLFETQQSKEDAGKEKVDMLVVDDLHPFKHHPFKVLDNEEMSQMVESVQQFGILNPLIVRPGEDGTFEIISGHRRARAAELAGLTTVPAIVRQLDDDAAIILMVDSNLARENILPSEKAKAYYMKYEAMKHQGSKSGGLTLDEIGEKAGESGKTVQRYIWLSRLSDELLELVDNKKIGFMQGVDISFLTEEQQQWVLVILQEKMVTISTTQSGKLKEHGKKGELTLPMVRLILTEQKPKERKVVIKADKISQYFPADYDSEDIESVIYRLLEEWKNRA